MVNIFDGIKVLEFAWILAGPLTSGYLAAHGATIVKIESMSQPDMLRTSPPFKDGIPGINRSAGFGGINANKYSMALDLNHPKSKDIVKRLVEWADVVSENYAPGRMEKWGLGYNDLKRIKPEIIMVRNSNQGQTGPHASRRGFGILLTSQIGFNSVTGWPDRGPNTSYIGYTDFIAPRFAATMLIAALLQKKKTGRGQCIDVSQAEASLQFMLPVFLDYMVNNRKEGRLGNSSPSKAPHAAYQCKGQDRWCAISVSTDAEWTALCQVMGNPEWSKNSKFDSLLSRKQNEDELNRLINDWTIKFDAYDIMKMLQEAGVSAGVVQNGKDLFEDPQLKSRNHTWNMQHDELGDYPFSALSIKLSKTPQEARMPAPCLGQHTQYVCQEFLGMSDEEFVELLSDGVFE